MAAVGGLSPRGKGGRDEEGRWYERSRSSANATPRRASVVSGSRSSRTRHAVRSCSSCARSASSRSFDAGDDDDDDDDACNGA